MGRSLAGLLLGMSLLPAAAAAQDSTISRLSWGSVNVLVRPDTVAGVRLWAETSVLGYNGKPKKFIASYDPAKVEPWLDQAHGILVWKKPPSTDSSMALQTAPLVDEDGSTLVLIRKRDKSKWAKQVTLLMIGPKGGSPWSIEAKVPEASALVQAMFVRASQSRYQPMADHVPDANLFSQEEAPSLIGTPAIYYPNFMQVRGRQGEVWAEYVVREDGTPDPDSFVAILSDGEGFTAAFRDAILKARFHPARVNGVPVARRVSHRATFRLH